MPSYPALALALLAASLALLPPCASGLILEVEPSRQRCLQEVLSRHDLVKGGYKLLNNPTEGERSGFLVRVRAVGALGTVSRERACGASPPCPRCARR